MSYTIRQQSTQGKEADKLEFEGALIIQSIKQIKQDIEQKINKTKPLHIRVSKIIQLDLSFLQLLLALKKDYDNLGLSIHIQMELEQDLQQLMQISGLYQLISPNISTQ